MISNSSQNIHERLASLEAQGIIDRVRLTASERKLRATWAMSGLAALVTLTIGWHKDAIAQGYGMTLAQAATRIAALETKTASMSVLAANDRSNTSGSQTVRFTGVNVQIVNGEGLFQEANDGTGNLIIGYNERRFSPIINTRTGSHNLVIGSYHNYSGIGGIVTGDYNTISGARACVFGGYGSTASGEYSTVSGGARNKAEGEYSSVSGGDTNTASGFASSVSGGNINTASGDDSSVSGGQNNVASGWYSSISGGPDRIITTVGGWVAGRRTGTSYTGYFNSP